MSKTKTNEDRRKHPRFIKRLTTTFCVDQSRFTGISSDLSEGGLFIRTYRGFPANTPIRIELMLPNNKTSSLKGIVRRTLRTNLSTKKNGMGIEIIEKDEPFIDFVTSVLGRDGNTAERTAIPSDFQNVSCYNYGVAKKDVSYPGQERRRCKRLQIEHLKVMSEMPSASKVKVINISMSGILLKADRRLDIGKTYVLKIGYKEKMVFVKTIVAWSLLVAGTGDAYGNITPFYIAGMQFMKNADEKLEELVNAINLDVPADPTQTNTLSTFHGDQQHNNILDNCPEEKGYALTPGEDNEDVPIKKEPVCFSEFTKKIEDIYRRHEQNSISYYEILNISNSADMEDIRKAYYDKVKEFHPDRYPHFSPVLKEKLTALSAYLNDAYKTLMNSGPQVTYATPPMPEKRKVVSNKAFAHQEFEKGIVEFWNDNLSEAEMFFKKSVSLDNSSGKYFCYYAKTLLRLGKLQEAEKSISEALKLDSSNTDYLVEAGYIYQAMNLSYRARENFEMALRLEPSHIKAQEGITELQRKNKNGWFMHSISNPIKALKKTIVR
ncbi:MAG: PilZ domain-containing protein [Thermodesulfovibrionales bacterium]|nr:PilZ domain-containing protein [Thermodesulfovibrionales bacterium]